MAWTAPSRRTTGEMVTAAIWNAVIVDDGLYLKAFEMPSGAIGIFTTDCPTGWTRLAGWDGDFIRGAASYGGVGGTGLHNHTAELHSHTISNHVHLFGFGTLSYSGGDAVTFTSGLNKNLVEPATGGSARGPVSPDALGGGATHGDGDDLTGDGNVSPPYVDVVFCKKN